MVLLLSINLMTEGSQEITPNPFPSPSKKSSVGQCGKLFWQPGIQPPHSGNQEYNPHFLATRNTTPTFWQPGIQPRLRAKGTG